jgi:NO-binding membrane sensor protein with MHYT domain
MHFVGMLAVRLDMHVGYDPLLTSLSLLLAIAASGVSFSLIAKGRTGALWLVGGGMVQGVGIAAMHYTGMAAMHMAADIRYDIGLLLLSTVVAVALSILAVWALFSGIRRDPTPCGEKHRRSGDGSGDNGHTLYGMAATRFVVAKPHAASLSSTAARWAFWSLGPSFS